MGLTDSAMVAAANTIRGELTHAQLHSDNPGANGTSNVTAAGRRPATWTAPTGPGNFELANNIEFTGGTPNGAVTHITFWTANTGGNHRATYRLDGDQTFNTAGEYTVTTGTLTGTTTDANS